MQNIILRVYFIALYLVSVDFNYNNTYLKFFFSTSVALLYSFIYTVYCIYV